jgi:hypothetical protein
MTFARLILAAANNEPVPKSKPFQLPSRLAAMTLVQYYLDNIFALFPVFSETALFNALDAVYQENGPPVTDFEHWLLYMVLAIGATGQSRSNQDAFYADGVLWVGRALRYADRVLMPGYVSQIQALILLVQYSMLDPAHFDSWQLIGFACRSVVDLGFHQDPPKEQQTDKKTLELRRRIFYCVYSLDRQVAQLCRKAKAYQEQVHQHGSCQIFFIHRRLDECCFPFSTNLGILGNIRQFNEWTPFYRYRSTSFSIATSSISLVSRAVSV